MNKHGLRIAEQDAFICVSSELLREIEAGELNITQYARNREWWMGPTPNIFTHIVVPLIVEVASIMRGFIHWLGL